MEIVTYLLGAGASAQCLPVVKDLSQRIRKVNQTLRNLSNNGNFYGRAILGSKSALTDIFIKISADLEWMATACDKHSSIDTFAKKLFILNSVEYSRLKIILSVYFTLEQKFNSPDLRYDNFWASILDKKDVFPKNLRIVSWNYDFQLEQSYLNFSDNQTLIDSYSNLSIRSFCDPKRDATPEGFAVYKLNGSATISDQNEQTSYFADNLMDDKDFYNKLFSRYAVMNENSGYKNNISFAWEHDLKNSYFQELKKSLWNTTTLVVIGYSFPYFNRKIDKYLIGSCMPDLRKIYFQAPDAQNVKERFNVINEAFSDDELLLKFDLDQFTFPNEL